jgi:hypothetical protein
MAKSGRLFSLHFKASLATKKQNGCQDKNAESYLAGIVKKRADPERRLD